MFPSTTDAITPDSFVTFDITDGQIGDDDLSANGAIVDAAGPGVRRRPGSASIHSSRAA